MSAGSCSVGEAGGDAGADDVGERGAVTGSSGPSSTAPMSRPTAVASAASQDGERCILDGGWSVSANRESSSDPCQYGVAGCGGSLGANFGDVKSRWWWAPASRFPISGVRANLPPPASAKTEASRPLLTTAPRAGRTAPAVSDNPAVIRRDRLRNWPRVSPGYRPCSRPLVPRIQLLPRTVDGTGRTGAPPGSPEVIRIVWSPAPQLRTPTQPSRCCLTASDESTPVNFESFRIRMDGPVLVLTVGLPHRKRDLAFSWVPV